MYSETSVIPLYVTHSSFSVLLNYQYKQFIIPDASFLEALFSASVIHIS